MLRDQGATVREIAEALGTSRATVYRVIQDADRGTAEAQDDDPAPAPQPSGPVSSISRSAALTRGFRSGSESIPSVP